MKIRTLLITTLVVFFLLLTGCASMRVLVNYDKTADFEAYQTYFAQKPQLKGKTQKRRHQNLFNKNVEIEIKRIMESKGYRQATSAKEADLVMHFYTQVKNRRDYVPPSYRVGRWGRHWVARPGHVVHYKEGTLGIDLVDRRKKELVWQGVGNGVLDRNNPSQNLIEAVEEVLSQFPPK